MKHLQGRVAVVTGGASGIGFGLARRLLGEGMKLVVADINASDLERAVAALQPHGEVIGQRCDVSDPASVEALAEASVARYGAVHLLCNNAGVGGYQRFDRISLDGWHWMLGVNLWGPILGCRAFLPILQAQDEAHIVNTASMAGFVYAPYNAPYNISKAGVVALSEGLYREFAHERPNIGISVLCPAFVATRIAEDERNAPPGHAPRHATDPDLDALRAKVSADLSAGKSVDQVAALVVEGIRERRLHIFTHPEWLSVIGDRAARILAGEPIDARFTGGLLPPAG